MYNSRVKRCLARLTHGTWVCDFGNCSQMLVWVLYRLYKHQRKHILFHSFLDDYTYLHSGLHFNFHMAVLTVTPTLVAASCRRGFFDALVVRTFPFLRHLLFPVWMMYNLSSAGSIRADNARHPQPAGYNTHTTVLRRRQEKCEEISVPVIQISSLYVLSPVCCVRKVTMWRTAEHLETQRGMETVSLQDQFNWIPVVIGQDVFPHTGGSLFLLTMKNTCSRSDLMITCIADYAEPCSNGNCALMVTC